jgi:hypothetical protein
MHEARTFLVQFGLLINPRPKSAFYDISSTCHKVILPVLDPIINCSHNQSTTESKNEILLCKQDILRRFGNMTFLIEGLYR